MSVSAHLTPEPERRLWLILESMRRAVDTTDARIGALTGFAAAQLAIMKLLPPDGPGSFLALASLTAALPLGVFAFAPLTSPPKWLRFLEPGKGRVSAEDCLISADDLVKYSHGDLIFRLDRYLGGGITATPYYEDIVGQIIENARIAARKRRLFRAVCVLVGVGQLGLLGQLIWR